MILDLVKRLLPANAKSKDEGATAMHELLSRNPLHPTIPLARHVDGHTGLRLVAGDSDANLAGEATLDGKTLAWREFGWTGPMHLDDSSWQSVRWRFYDNGLVCFAATMSNSETGLHFGGLQGHRIELRETGGFLLGAWTVGFYVRRGGPPCGYQADIVDDHAPLKMHFSQIADVQTGLWIAR